MYTVGVDPIRHCLCFDLHWTCSLDVYVDANIDGEYSPVTTLNMTSSLDTFLLALLRVAVNTVKCAWQLDLKMTCSLAYS